MTLLESALIYANKGIRVFPLKPGSKGENGSQVLKSWSKGATVDLDKIRSWWSKNPNYNIGIATGQRLLVIDLDVKEDKNGIESMTEWVLMNGPLPNTAKARTGSGGEHLYYWVNGSFKNAVDHMPGIDIRSDGGYVVAPPSIHKNGNEYVWLNDLPIAEADQSVYDFLAKRERIKYFELPEVIEEGHRDDTIFRYACSLQAKGVPDDILMQRVIEANETRCNPPLQDAEVKKKIEQALKKPKGGSEHDLSRFHKFNREGQPTGILDLEIVKDIMESEYFFAMGDNMFVYDQGVYYEDKGGLVIKSWIQERICPKFVTSRTINSVYNLLLQQKVNQMDYKDLNQYPDDWINFKNGMFNVKEWVMLPHNPKYYALNQVPHNFCTEMPKEGKILDAFLESSIPNEDDQEMLFEYVGYCLTKDISQEKMLILKGRGGTGKSKLIKLLNAAVGARNYSNIPMQKLNERFYAIELFGKLVNTCADIPSDPMKAVDIIKQLVSGDYMMGERKGKDPISFQNRAKLVFSGNDIPLNLDENSNAFYRRLLILRMDNIPQRVDTDLEVKLLGEMDVFLYRAVKALSTMYLLGEIAESNNSKEEVTRLHIYSDTVEAFMNAKVKSDRNGRVERNALYTVYEAFCYEEERKPLSRNSFYKSLRESKGVNEIKSNGLRYFQGITV